MIQERLAKLRQEMQRLHLKAYILTNNDPHQSEYVPDYYKVREYFSGFSGSVGTFVVLTDCAALWVDGRFEVHARREVEGTDITVFVTREQSATAYVHWLKEQLTEGDFVGFDGRTMPYADYRGLEAGLKSKRIVLKPQIDFIDLIWTDRPAIPISPLVQHPIEYAIQSPYEKLLAIQKDMETAGLDYYILSDLNDIAWLTNLRGRQVPQNPLFYAFFLIGKHESILFTHLKCIDKTLHRHLSENRILLQDYRDIESFVKSLKRSATVVCDDTKTSVWLVKSLPSQIGIVTHKNLVALKRAIKSEEQINHAGYAQLRECVFMFKYLHWLKHKRNRKLLNEWLAAQTYYELRRKHPLFYDDCFHIVSAYRENGTLMHYNPKTNPRSLEGSGFYLVNAGAHYYDGTTDLSRVLYFGKPTEKHKLHYTAILKGLIAISSARFIKGTTGAQLDILARQHIWAIGLDYHCATGHGIGYMQAIHEGPHGISPTNSQTPLEVGMMLTLEPGIYIDGQYGIRLENIVSVVPVRSPQSEVFYQFETLTYCPFETTLIEKSLLSSAELSWLNTYHQMTYERLKDGLKPEEQENLRLATRPL